MEPEIEQKPIWKRMSSGKYIDLRKFSASDVVLSDIIVSLQRQTRFDGHGKHEPLNVLQHSMLVADIMRRRGYDAHYQLLGLTHDAHEAYIGDIGTPVKMLFGFRAEDERRLVLETRVALNGTELNYFYTPVKESDVLALDVERRVIWDDPEDEAEYHKKYWPVPLISLTTGECIEWFHVASTYQEADFEDRYHDLRRKADV